MDASLLKAEVESYVDEVWEDVVRDIDRLVQIESVEDLSAAKEGMPWGPAAYEALQLGLTIARERGLDVHEVEGALGYGELKGKSDTVIATIAHSDIVPLGKGWTVDPLHVTRREGYLLGRGVLDDKGPLVLSLYAAHFFARKVKNEGMVLPYTLHAIVGNNEETGMADVDYYLRACGQPAFCFTPDADFPLICGEKGILHGSFTSQELPEERTVVELDGGTVANAIPGSASALVRGDMSELPPADNIELAQEGELVRVVATGKGGHASLPAGTVNAINLLVSYLLGALELSREEKTTLELIQRICGSSDGSLVGIDCADDKFGALTAIGGTVRTNGKHFVQTIDSRYPTAIDSDTICARLSELAEEHGASFELLSNAVPFYIEPDSPEISCLLQTYSEYTGHPAEAVVIGGGTYARHFERACAFGPNDPYTELPEWAGIEHGPDEGIAEDTLKVALKIYIVSIARLMELELS